jgi:hypothetical protein
VAGPSRQPDRSKLLNRCVGTKVASLNANTCFASEGKGMAESDRGAWYTNRQAAATLLRR